MGFSQSKAWRDAYPPHIQRLAELLANKNLKDICFLDNSVIFWFGGKEEYKIQPEELQQIIQALVQHNRRSDSRILNLGNLASVAVRTLKMPLKLSPMQE